jgi:hypothetical protein
LKLSILLVVCFLVICSVFVSPSVEVAQTTTVSQVNGPSSAVAGSMNPLSVSATVYYNNAGAGYELLVGILDVDLSPQGIVPGVVISSTDPCVNEPAPAAVCVIAVPKPSGSELIDFQIGGIFGGRRAPGKWDLNITSALLDHQNNLVPGSVSSKLFEIALTPVALNVDVPSSVRVSIDGVQQSAGSVSIGVALGQHNITVPQLVNVSQSTRLRFDHWSDGYPTVLRTIVVRNSTTLQAVYVTQNLLALIGVEKNSTISTWYDADANATFSVNPYEPMTGVLATLGAKLSLQGWYENGKLLTTSPTGTIAMDKPHTLTAVWQVDYSSPATVTLAIVAVIVVILLLLRRKAAVSATQRGGKTRRKHS